MYLHFHATVLVSVIAAAAVVIVVVVVVVVVVVTVLNKISFSQNTTIYSIM